MLVKDALLHCHGEDIDFSGCRRLSAWLLQFLRTGTRKADNLFSSGSQPAHFRHTYTHIQPNNLFSSLSTSPSFKRSDKHIPISSVVLEIHKANRQSTTHQFDKLKTTQLRDVSTFALFLCLVSVCLLSVCLLSVLMTI